MSCGYKFNDVDTIPPSVLLDKLLGRWDPVRKIYPKMTYLMDLMESGIGMGGGPIRGVNFTTRCRAIRKDMVGVLGGKPSEDVMFATVLALYRVKKHVALLIDQSDPLTGALLVS